MCWIKAVSKTCARTWKFPIRKRYLTATSILSLSPVSSKESEFMDARTVAVVTGASRGLGKALAEQLLGAGARVITIARSHNPALAEIAQRHGAPLQQVLADLSQPESIETAAGMMSAAIPADGTRYLLLNNAGTVDPVKRADELFDAKAVEKAFNLNVVAVMVLTAAFL